MALDKKKLEAGKREIANDIQTEKGILKGIEDNKKNAMDTYAEVYESDIDPDLKSTILERKNQEIAQLEQYGQEHSDQIAEKIEKYEELKDEAAETAENAKKAAERLNKMASMLEKAGLSVLIDAAADSSANAEEWEKEKQEILEKNAELDQIRQSFQNL